ncbi:hypothetical protein TorRG33x02_033290 [Trema orientale]|uniref:Uncharacterized protein n=1 Tax=Trema orientale TaxID=63057 RepID=A0A2P5FSB6_TREOI|nr:hypothetical protein TorRG33x02_033290 [Trema orientale]
MKCSCRKLMKSAKKDRRISEVPDYSDSEESLDECAYKIQGNEDSNSLRRPSRYFTVASVSPDQGFSRKTPIKPVDTGLYPSSFHNTPDRRRFSKQGWEKFTKDSTEGALEELVSSPGFGKWLHQNADRITVTPNSGKSEQKQRKSLLWF